MLIQIEPTGRSRRHIVAQREMPITISVTAARSNVCRIEDVDVDKLDVGADTVVPFRVSLFDVFVPEIDSLEKLGAVWDFAAVFIDVFLFDILKSRMVSNVRLQRRSWRDGIPC